MCSKRDVVIFFAGAEAFHALSHLTIGFSGMLPMTFFSFTITQQFVLAGAVVHAAIAAGLLWWASRLAK